MPQLMPLNWIFSVLMTILLLMFLVNIYGYNFSKDFSIYKKQINITNKWFW